MDSNLDKKNTSIFLASQYNFWLNIYKPKGVSSAKLVSIVKSYFNKSKVGHCGTLDVEAQGVLPIAVGEATKLVRVLVDAKKTYIFTIEFGKKTDTADSSGKIINVTNTIPSKEQCFNICKNFIGTLSQYPPAFSAIKINGVRAYKLARENSPLKLAPRNITIYHLECLNFNHKDKQAIYMVECSKGTYIRSLAEDIALSLQSLGFVVELHRTKVGLFSAEEAIRLIELDLDTRLLSKITIAGELERRAKCKALTYLNICQDLNLGSYSSPLAEVETEKKSNQDIIKKFLVEHSIKIEAVLDDILVLSVTLEQAQQIIYGQKCYFDYPKNIDLIWLKYNDTLLAIGNVNENCFNSFRVFNLIKMEINDVDYSNTQTTNN
ncbi:tRNA pseudouridine(55) synthase TruB [Candidatus Tisiphia endosymbiont of Nemotelus uliginosus]|uniref:tRNA pseudouridine(55) synthase TruB n=1 Tax=Candidatus Tisiphia endosymbiont of Nemotelus uliginosus TaxID=3077926 RepID=UPI0039777134